MSALTSPLWTFAITEPVARQILRRVGHGLLNFRDRQVGHLIHNNKRGQGTLRTSLTPPPSKRELT